MILNDFGGIRFIIGALLFLKKRAVESYCIQLRNGAYIYKVQL